MIFYLLVVFVAATGPCGKVPEFQAKLLYNNNFIFASICKHSVKGNFSKNGKKLKNVNLSQNARLTVLCRRQICLPPLRTTKRPKQFVLGKTARKTPSGGNFPLEIFWKNQTPFLPSFRMGESAKGRRMSKLAEFYLFLLIFTPTFALIHTVMHILPAKYRVLCNKKV